MQARRAEIPGKWREAEGGGRRPGERAPWRGLGTARGGPAAKRPSLRPRRGAALRPGPASVPPRPAPLPVAAPALAPAAADCCLLSSVLPLIGTSEQPALRARRTCQCPRDAATLPPRKGSIASKEKGRVKDGQKSPASTEILTKKGKMLC